jgi:WD40 repeat protein
LQTTRDSKYLITGVDKRVRTILIGNRELKKYLFKEVSHITAMKSSADSKNLFIGDMSGYLRLMSLTNGKTITDFGWIHDYGIAGIVTTVDEKFFYTCCEQGFLKQWTYEDTTLVRYYGRKGLSLANCICL